MLLLILATWAETDAICEYRFQAVEICSDDIRMTICDEPQQALPYTLSHDTGFAVIHVKAFFHCDCRHMN